MRAVAISMSILLTAACSSNATVATGADEPSVETTPIEEAVIAWNEANLTNYLVRAIDNDRTSLDAGCTWIAEVHDGDIDTRSTAMFDVECGDWDVSVPELHQQIIDYQTDVNQDGGRLEVEWTDAGVPTEIDFAPTDGDHISLTIEFQDLDNQASVRTDLAVARSRWFAADISNYQIELVELTNHWVGGCRWTTTVSDGQPLTSSVDTDTNSYCSEIDWTVDLLFDMVASWADEMDEFSDPAYGEHTLTATYDEHGVPLSLVFDLANGSDEESSMQISFTQLSD